MDRLAIDVGSVYPITILSHKAEEIQTDRGTAPMITVDHGGQQFEWVVAKKAYEQLVKLLGAASWAGRQVSITKIKEGNYTRILVSLASGLPIPVPATPSTVPLPPSPTPPPVSIQPPGQRIDQVISHATPFSIELTRGQRGGYGYTLKVRSLNVPELIGDLNQALVLVRMTIDEQEKLDKRISQETIERSE